MPVRPPARALLRLCALLLVLGFSPAAFADAIDGEWCRDGRHFRIDGPEIVTYGGNRLIGDYDRHGFRYTAPANETDAGARVEMVLRGEEMLHLFRRPKDAPGHDEAPEIWRRCLAQACWV